MSNAVYTRGYRDVGFYSYSPDHTTRGVMPKEGVIPMAMNKPSTSGKWEPTTAYLFGLIIAEVLALAGLKVLLRKIG
jgi:hypothetical protein